MRASRDWSSLVWVSTVCFLFAPPLRQLATPRHEGGEALSCFGYPYRLSILASKSATLFSILKMSINSAENDRAMVLWLELVQTCKLA
jgi:hypothetical protein